MADMLGILGLKIRKNIEKNGEKMGKNGKNLEKIGGKPLKKLKKILEKIVYMYRLQQGSQNVLYFL